MTRTINGLTVSAQNGSVVLTSGSARVALSAAKAHELASAVAWRLRLEDNGLAYVGTKKKKAAGVLMFRPLVGDEKPKNIVFDQEQVRALACVLYAASSAALVEVA